MGETNQERPGTPGRRPGPPAPQATHVSAVLTPPTGLPAVERSVPSVPAQRAPAEPVTAAPPPRAPEPPAPPVRSCVCGHPQDVHEHYRAGDDCGACGADTCAGFRDRDRDRDGVGPLRRVLRRLVG